MKPALPMAPRQTVVSAWIMARKIAQPSQAPDRAPPASASAAPSNSNKRRTLLGVKPSASAKLDLRRPLFQLELKSSASAATPPRTTNQLETRETTALSLRRRFERRRADGLELQPGFVRAQAGLGSWRFTASRTVSGGVSSGTGYRMAVSVPKRLAHIAWPAARV